MGRLGAAGQNRRVMFFCVQLLTDNKRLVTMINDWGSLALLASAALYNVKKALAVSGGEKKKQKHNT